MAHLQHSPLAARRELSLNRNGLSIRGSALDYSLLIPALIAGIFFWIAETREGSLKTTKPRYSQTFFTEVPASPAFKSVTGFATKNGYRRDDFDEHQLAVILNKRMTPTGSGSPYPIYARQNVMRTEVEIGVTKM